jgi:hypothetical protein
MGIEGSTHPHEPGERGLFLAGEKNQGKGKIYAATVINSEITELKTVSGNRSTLATDFRQGYKQGGLLSDISPGGVKAKIARELKNQPGMGYFICYFEVSGVLGYRFYEELWIIIGTGQKNRPRLIGTGFGWLGWRFHASPTSYNITTNKSSKSRGRP